MWPWAGCLRYKALVKIWRPKICRRPPQYTYCKSYCNSVSPARLRYLSAFDVFFAYLIGAHFNRSFGKDPDPWIISDPDIIRCQLSSLLPVNLDWNSARLSLPLSSPCLTALASASVILFCPEDLYYGSMLRIRIRDLVPFWPLDPGWVKKSGPGSGMNNPDHISEELWTQFLG